MQIFRFTIKTVITLSRFSGLLAAKFVSLIINHVALDQNLSMETILNLFIINVLLTLISLMEFIIILTIPVRSNMQFR